MVDLIYHTLLWICSILAILSGLDDTLIDLVYWFNIIKYKRMLPKFKDIGMGKEKSIALIICAWKEFRVIERTLNTALEKLKYSNYKMHRKNKQ